MTDGVQFHYHLAKNYASEAAELLAEAEQKMHAAVALFELSKSEGESRQEGPESDLAKAVALRKGIESCSTAAFLVGRL